MHNSGNFHERKIVEKMAEKAAGKNIVLYQGLPLLGAVVFE
jgi:hypothetical protein